MTSHKVSDLLKTSLAQGLYRGCVQGKPAVLLVPFGGSNVCFEMD